VTVTEPISIESRILSGAKHLIEPPERLAPPYFAAVDAHGNETDHCGPLAVAWCPMAAILRVARDNFAAAERAESLLSEAMGGERVADFAATHQHDAILAAFDRAIVASGVA
jgi:hypothetical protein